MKLGVPFTPSEVNDHVGTGDYAAKYVTFLRRDGFVFESVKDGRRIVSYTLVKEPDNADFFRNMKAKEPAVKEPKEKKAKVEKPKKVVASKKKAVASKKAAPKKGGNPKNLAKLKEVGKTFSANVESSEMSPVETSEPVVGSIDSGWDSIEGVNLKDLL